MVSVQHFINETPENDGSDDGSDKKDIQNVYC